MVGLIVLSVGTSGLSAFLVYQLTRANKRILELQNRTRNTRELEHRIKTQSRIISDYAHESALRRLDDEYKRGVRDGRSIERIHHAVKNGESVSSPYAPMVIEEDFID